jgi:uncharacterized protein YjbI with pentapeptide repeats
MKIYDIISRHSDKILFSGRFRSFRHTLESAVTNNTDLTGADLRARNLSGISLDDALLDQADFTGSNLTGANLSEARLRGASFINTCLYNTCFAYSDLQGCSFIDASFGGTDITGSNLSHSTFSTLSCFSLDFVDAAAMTGCIFTNPDGMIATMSKPPLVIKGASRSVIIFMDRTVKIDHALFDYPGGIAVLKKSITDRNSLN